MRIVQAGFRIRFIPQGNIFDPRKVDRLFNNNKNNRYFNQESLATNLSFHIFFFNYKTFKNKQFLKYSLIYKGIWRVDVKFPIPSGGKGGGNVGYSPTIQVHVGKSISIW